MLTPIEEYLINEAIEHYNICALYLGELRQLRASEKKDVRENLADTTARLKSASEQMLRCSERLFKMNIEEIRKDGKKETTNAASN